MIEVKNLTKKYGDFTAVDNISFTIQEGEIVGLLGPNGAGKSTTMNMITGFIEQTEGEVIVDGYNMLKKPKKAKKEIGYMPEGVPLYTDLTVKEFVTYMAEIKKINKKERKERFPLYTELTVKEFVTYMAEIKKVDRKTRKERVEKIIKQTGLEDVQKKLIKNLSRGYKQRVSMAGALVGDPKILILDEPTVGLDPKQITEIRNLIKELGKTHTVILSSHILSEVSQICNKVIIINKGKMIAIDTPQKLEERVQNKNCIYVTVEDPENKLENIKNKIKNIKNITLLEENEDNTKKYIIETEGEDDIRKLIFSEFAKENITIFEMKKADTTLEDAFMKLIEEGGEK